MKPDAEAVNDEAKLIMSRIIARRIATDPGVVDRARAAYAVWSPEDRATKPAAYWIEILELGPETVRRRITQRDEQAYWMRNSTPLALSAGLYCLRECPSSDDLRLFRRLRNGGSGSSGFEVMRPAADAASVSPGWSGV